MGRIALFVILVGGFAYFVIEQVFARALGATPSPVISISLAVLVAVIVWTVLVWRFADRQGGGRTDAKSEDGPGPADSSRG